MFVLCRGLLLKNKNERRTYFILEDEKVECLPPLSCKGETI